MRPTISARLRLPLEYTRKHGLLGLVRRASTKLWRALFKNWQCVFYLESPDLHDGGFQMPDGLVVERYAAEDEIPQETIGQLSAVLLGGEERARQYLRVGFRQSGQFWLARLGGEIVGYHWTEYGFERFWYFPLTAREAVISAAVVLPDYRGRGIWPAMIQHTLLELKREGAQRFLISVERWNQSSMRAVSKIGYKRMGNLRLRRALRRHIVIWSVRET